MIKYLLRISILKRLIPSFYKRYLFITKNYNKEITLNKVIYNLDLRHLIDRRFFLHEGYEDELFFNLKKIIDNNNINLFLDIGSCWGLYSLRLNGYYKKLKIFSFDPIKKNISRLKISIKKNKAKNIKTFHIGLGSKKEIIKFGATEYYSPNYEINVPNSVINEYCKVNLLDNLIKYKNKKIILKIDTEGHELEVLKGAIFLLKNNKCFCQVEVKNKNKKSVFYFFKKNNYKLVSINKTNKTDFFFSNFTKENILI